MGAISMWILKRVFKSKLKSLTRDNPNMSDMSLLSSTTNGDIKKLKRRIFILNILIPSVIIFTLLTGIITASILFSTSHTAMAVAANAIMSILDEDKKKEEEAEKDGWEWEKDQGGNSDGDNNSSGGLYPKDRKLRLRAELLEMIDESAKMGVEQGYSGMETGFMLGTMIRETGTSFFNVIDNSSVTSLFKELMTHSPACLWDFEGATCTFNKAGLSHFYGGSVSNGVDSGDPYTQVADSRDSSYKTAGNYGRPDHAIGYVQFETRYIYDKTAEFYRMYKNMEPITSSSNPETASQEVQTDNDLGFIRPNIMYMPDEIFNCSLSMAKRPDRINTGTYDSILNSSEYNSLSEYNQNCLKFIFSTQAYVKGTAYQSDADMMSTIMSLVTSGKMTEVDEVLIADGDSFWDETNMVTTMGEDQFIPYVKNKYGVNLGSSVQYHGWYSASIGRLMYEKTKALIDAAEKEGGTTGGSSGSSDGNWLDHPGSGKFGNDGSPYYVDSLGVRFYSQTRENPEYGDKWWDIPLNGWSSNYNRPATLETGGCGVYTVAMVASNLLNKDITPDIVRGMLSNDMVGNCLYDTGVDYAITQLGLTYKKLTYTTSDAIEQVNDELNKGNLVIFVSERGPSPWYGGAGHFMALRGIDENGNYLSLNSAGNARNGRNPIDLMGEAVTPSAWKASLSGVRNYVWVVGLNVS